MIEQPIRYLFTLIESCLLYLLLCNLLKCKISGTRQVVVFSIISMLDALFVSLFASIFPDIIKTILYYLIPTIVIILLFEDKFCIKVYFIILAHFIYLISDLLVGCLALYLYGIDIQKLITSSIFALSLMKFINIMLIIACVIFFRRINFEISRKYWVISDVIIGMFFVIAYFFLDVTFLTQNTDYSIVVCGISLGFLVMSILVVYFLGEISFFYQKSNENSILALKNQVLEQQLAFQETSAVEMNKVRHDINRNIANIAYLLKQNDISEAISYINDITLALESTKAIINSGNRIIDIILNYEMAICKKNNINIEAKIDNLPDLNISQIDLTGIVSNMLDNAIEANENMEPAERYISVKMFCYKNYLSIIIKNPYAHSIVLEKGLIRTNKGDIFRHGYGLKSIKASAEKYGGNFKFEIQDNIFTAMVILPIEF